MSNKKATDSGVLYYGWQRDELISILRIGESPSCQKDLSELNWDKLKPTIMNKLPINIPAGHEVDWEASKSSNEIIFKKKGVSYEDVAEKLFNGSVTYCTSDQGGVKRYMMASDTSAADPNNSTTKEQLEAIMELNKLCNVAKWKNDGWLPDFESHENKYYFCIQGDIEVQFTTLSQYGFVYFHTKEAALEAITILGEESIRKALTLNH